MEKEIIIQLIKNDINKNKKICEQICERLNLDLEEFP